MTPQETEQVAALRMHVAHLHNALTLARMLVGESESETIRVTDEARKELDAALASSEPELRALLLAIGSDDQVLSKLQSEAVNAAVASVRSHHEELHKARTHGETVAAHASEQLRAQGRNFSALAAAARAVIAAKAAAVQHPEGPQEAEWLALCKAINALERVVPG